MADRFECSVASRERDEPVAATASQVSSWLLVEVNGPWGRDAIGHSELGPHAPAIWRQAIRRQGVRVIAVRRHLVRHHEDEHDGHRLVHISAPRPGGPAGVASRRVVEDLHDVVSATASLADGHGVDDEWTPDPERYVLVCTNGRHDACCATFGRPLVRALRDSRWGDEVWECSHIGGDRFAGNVVLLPDSLYFGHCDAADAERILAAHDDGRLDLANFRGRSTFRLAEQAAEHYVRVESGLDGLAAVQSVEPLGDGRIRVLVDAADHVATYVVTIERTTAPSSSPLTCKGDEGLSYPSFHLVAMARG
ncbi:MAG: sucrase ferredoxin [Ilumatobacteraceae bacterium]